MSLWFPSSCCSGRRLVESLVLEHCVENIAAASGETDQSGIMFLAFSPFAVVIGATGRVVQGRERGQEQRTFEFAVS